MEKLKGSIERITYHNRETGFCVLQVQVQGQSALACIVGMANTIAVGETVEANGTWVKDKTYGRQFKAESLQLLPPDSLEGIEKYLASGAVKGVGKHYAKLLVNAFGADVFTVIEKSPERLNNVAGIGKKRRQQILSSWSEQTAIHNVMVFLQTHGMGTARAAKIYKAYGDKAVDYLQENPYRLVHDIPGIGFKTADMLAEKLGIPRDSMLRACAGVHYILQEFSDEGHCAATETALLEHAASILSIPLDIITAAIEQEIRVRRLVREETEQGSVIYLLSLYQAEQDVAKHLKRLREGMTPWGEVDGEKALPWVEERTGVALSNSQRAAIQAALKSKVFIITGGPGVGKTTVVKSLLTILRAKRVQTALCAPTGRAAKRLSETTGIAAKTIHRLLEFDPHLRVFQNNSQHPLTADLVIVDEASMLDVVLMAHLLAAIPDHAALLLIGDVDQLPSVGPGAVLADVLNAEGISSARLTEIFRQAQTSQIILNAHRINHGEMPQALEKNQNSDFYFINVESPEAICSTVLELVTERIPQRFGYLPVQDIQVLTPMNKGSVGSRMLNSMLQEKLNGVSEPKITRFDWTFAPRDKVIQLVNNYDKDVFNGDIGQIAGVEAGTTSLRVNYDGRIVEYEAQDLDELALAYAMSIHKSQGSEYPVVVIALAEQHHRMLVRNLLYTAVTRGKELVVIVGQARALKTAVSTVETGQRITRLTWRLGND